MLPLFPSPAYCAGLPIEQSAMSAGAWLPQNKAQASHSKVSTLNLGLRLPRARHAVPLHAGLRPGNGSLVC